MTKGNNKCRKRSIEPRFYSCGDRQRTKDAKREADGVGKISSIEILKIPLTYQSGRDWREIICAFHKDGNHPSRGMQLKVT